VRVLIEPDIETLSRKAASLVAQLLLAKPHTTLALPTGRTPLGLYRELSRIHREEKLDFSGARIFNLDEYIGVPPTDARSFDHYLHQHFLSQVNIRTENVKLLSYRADNTVCAGYERTIQADGGIDLLIAGVGTNGHIAFNEPGSTPDSRTRIVELAESTRTNMQAVFNEEEIPTHAATMGIGTILEARKILVLASGRTKKNALDGLLHGPVTIENPVSAMRLHTDVTIIADQEASSGLSESSRRS
jgi:glucosamine-6-phosphate deaminase